MSDDALRRARRRTLAVIAGSLLVPAGSRAASEADRVAPYGSTEDGIVDEMLRLADVGPRDFVVDLGSGDGRLVIAAVLKFNARGGFGVDIEPGAVDYSNRMAAQRGVADRVRFYERDLFVTDVREATVVTLYLFPAAMPRVEAKLLAELNPGARVVSHDFPFPNWKPERIATFEAPVKRDYHWNTWATLYLYRVPDPRQPK